MTKNPSVFQIRESKLNGKFVERERDEPSWEWLKKKDKDKEVNKQTNLELIIEHKELFT